MAGHWIPPRGRSREGGRLRPDPAWSREKMLALLIGAVLLAGVLIAGVALAVRDAVSPSRHAAATPGPAAGNGSTTAGGWRQPSANIDPRDELAARPMPTVDAAAAHPGPVTTLDPGAPLVLPAATAAGPAGVPTGFPRSPAGALAQLAAIDQVALQSGPLAGAREVIAHWALPGGPTAENWSVIAALATLFDSAGLSGGGSAQLAIVATPLMGVIKGSVGPDFVVPCVDFELDVTLAQTARGATADCQRMTWDSATSRWLIGPGPEPATPPSVWPDTDAALGVGYRDLRPEHR